MLQACLRVRKGSEIFGAPVKWFGPFLSSSIASLQTKAILALPLQESSSSGGSQM